MNSGMTSYRGHSDVQNTLAGETGEDFSALDLLYLSNKLFRLLGITTSSIALRNFLLLASIKSLVRQNSTSY